MATAKTIQTSIKISILAAAIVGAAALPAHAKVCKDEISAKSRSAGQYADAQRQKRAHANAIANWSDRTRSTYGIAYRFWTRSNEKSVECKTGKSSVTCEAKAKPCRLI
jgi:hypothetical protein